MHGNVSEFCSDWLSAYKGTTETDPIGPSIGTVRAFRGGSWADYSAYCRVSMRLGVKPSERNDFIGFRIVCSG
jgi:formylglycine-generating enzyme required for sulfatase activity